MIKIALVPAGGRGIGLYPSTRAFPKELYHFAGKPVVEHVISSIKACGITDIVFVAGYKKSALLDYIGDGSLFGINASFVYQEKPTGPGDAILCGNTRIKRDSTNKDFLVSFGDNIIIPPTQIQEVINVHEKHKPLATVLVFPTTTPTRYGITQLESINGLNIVTDIVEKPQTPQEQEALRTHSGQYMALSSIMVFNVRIFEYLRQISPDKEDKYQIADALVKAIHKGERILAYQLAGHFIDISDWDFLWKLREYFKNMSDEELANIIEERKNLARKLGVEL